MPIPGILQPEILPAGEGLRLRKFDGQFAFAFPWYQDPETVWLADGVRQPYTLEKLERMYRFLDSHGELYFIEVWEGQGWKPVGDVTFWQEDLPIVLGDKTCRGRHMGRKVLSALIRRARDLGYSWLAVQEIYEYNVCSRRCFESLGFRPREKTDLGYRYYLEL